MSPATRTVSAEPLLPRILNAEPAPASGERERILIVDDSRMVRRMFYLDLSERFECVEAESFEDAVAKLKTQEFSVVITDIIMPGLSGIELLRKVVAEHPDTPVIIVSGVDRPQRAVDAMRLGAFDYLIKPCEIDVLEMSVERALERRNLVLNTRRYKLDLETRNVELVRSKEQLERLQMQIVHTEKMASLGQLAAGVAHELNNPVGFVYANIEILAQYFDDLSRLLRTIDGGAAAEVIEDLKKEIGYPSMMDDIASILGDCRDGAERIRGIVQNLRTFSRLDEAEYTETNIHEGIDATIRLLSRYFGAGNITIRRNYGELPSVQTFSGQLNQVWMNLLANAAQAIGTEKGVVTVSTRADKDNIFVDITDTGCGIAVQDLKRIFDPFFTTKAVGAGTGLGLSISLSIIERHGGSIAVSTVLGQGTTFKVRLPRNFEPNFSVSETSIAPYAS